MITRQDVCSAYALLLGREPENEAVISHWIQRAVGIDQMAIEIIGSSEFKDRLAAPVSSAHGTTSARDSTDNRKANFSVHPEPKLINWLNNLDSIEGWLSPSSAFVSAALTQMQKRAGYRGNIAEIGVYHGKYLVGLATTLCSDEKAIAIDIFEDQEKNADLVGYDEVGSIGIHSLTEQPLHINARRYCPDANIALIKRSSLDVTPKDILGLGDMIRFFSIDGGHTRDILMNDLRLAEATLAPHGIISIDDILNAQWPGVVTGAVRFFDGKTDLRPVAFIANKLLCAFAPYADQYRQTILDITPNSLQRRNVEFSNYTADQYFEGDDLSLFLQAARSRP